jgi:hypothetical protein
MPKVTHAEIDLLRLGVPFPPVITRAVEVLRGKGGDRQ